MAESKGKPKPRQIAMDAVEQVQDLIGRPVESVTGISRDDDDGEWIVTLEVLELERVPSTTDVLGKYEPLRLRSIIRSHSSVGAFSIGPGSIWPALLTTTSSRPSSSTVRSTAPTALALGNVRLDCDIQINPARHRAADDQAATAGRLGRAGAEDGDQLVGVRSRR